MDVMRMPAKTSKFMRDLKRNAPKILKIGSLIGLIVTPVLTVPATVKAVRACDRRKEELGVEKLPVGEIVKTSWKYYIPAAALMTSSTVGAINGERIDIKRTGLLREACNAAEQTIADYKEETLNKLGEKKAKEIETGVLEKRTDRLLEDRENLLIQGDNSNGATLFCEPITGTLFYSTRNKIDKAFNELSAQMIRENYVDLGDLFDYLGLRRVEACNGYGWSSSRVKTITPDYIWHGREDDDLLTPYVIMSYELYPTTNYIDNYS